MPQHTNNAADKKTLRRQLRSNSTPAERALWQILRKKQVEGLVFRRQYSIANYILDFYCPALHLAIELDGDYHNHGAAIDYDYHRNEYLQQNHGIKTLRFENKIVFEDPEAIIHSIQQELEDMRDKGLKV